MRHALRKCWAPSAALMVFSVMMGTGAEAQGTVIETEITSPSLEGNLLGDPATRGISVYLPPCYEASADRNYPTVYLLNGFMSEHTEYTWSANAFFLAAGLDLGIELARIADGLVATGAIGEMIVVMPDGNNRYGGSWYERSPVIGDYRDYIARDVVNFVEGSYRVQSGGASRAIAGHSMGGYGALSLAMEYPDVYSAVVALSPAMGDMTISPTYLEAFLAENPDSLRAPIPIDLTLDVETKMVLAGLVMTTSFNTNLLYAFAAGVTPNAANPPLFLDFPVKGREDWERFKREWLDPAHPDRLAGNWRELGRQWMADGIPIQLGSYPDVTFYGGVRWLLGDEECLMAFYTMPDLVHDIMEHLTTVYLTVFEQVAAEVRIDVVHIWEDMCGRQGPLISPRLWEEFMGPHYRRIKQFTEAHDIPVLSVERLLKDCWPPQWLAFYQTKFFGKEAHAVSYYARVLEIRQVSRWQLFPDEPHNEKSQKRYYQLILSPLERLPSPILSPRWRRMVFIPTTWIKLTRAVEINDLYDESPLEDRLWAELKRYEIAAERQFFIKAKDRQYALDFAVFCDRGKIDVETDGDTWHADPARIPLDNRRDNDLTGHDWRILRFNGKQVRESAVEYCIPAIMETSNRLGGIVTESIMPRTFDPNDPGGSRQMTLFESGPEYDLD